MDETRTLQDLTLEEVFEELEHVVEELESPEINLEESFALYNQGMQMLKQCSTLIDAVEKKVLVLDEDGETYEF